MKQSNGILPYSLNKLKESNRKETRCGHEKVDRLPKMAMAVLALTTLPSPIGKGLWSFGIVTIDLIPTSSTSTIANVAQCLL